MEGIDKAGLNAAAGKIRAATYRTGETIIDIGRQFSLARAKFKNAGGFETFVVNNTSFSYTSAVRYIRVFEAFGELNVGEIDIDALFLASSESAPVEAVQQIANLSRRERVTVDSVRDILAAHLVDAAPDSSADELIRIADARTALSADRGLNAALDNGGTLYLTRMNAEDDESEIVGTLLSADGRPTQATGRTAADAILRLTGNPVTKACRLCGKEKELSQFERSESRCKVCRSQQASELWRRNRDKRNGVKQSPATIPASD